MNSIIKIMIFMILSSACYVTLFDNKASGNSPRLLVQLNTENKVISSEQSVILHVVVTNNSYHDVTVHKSRPGDHAEQDFHIIVLDKDGNIVDKSDYYKNKVVTMESVIVETMKQYESMEETANLSKLFNIQGPGKYSVEVICILACSGLGGPFKSDSLDFFVE